MFRKKGSSDVENPSRLKQGSAGPGKLNRIVEGSLWEGNCKSDFDFRIDGTFIGDLTCGAKVIIGQKGKFQGNIQCVSAVIEGEFQGEMIIQELLQVADSARVTGDVETDKLIVESGALFQVSCKMKSPHKSTQSSSPKKGESVREAVSLSR